MIDIIVIANYAGEDRAFIEGVESFGSFGIAIYFPSEKVYLDADTHYSNTNTLFPVEFVLNYTWDDFLHEYFAVN